GQVNADLRQTRKNCVSGCNKRIGVLEDALSSMDSRIIHLEKANERLCKENNTLKEKAELLENHSRKYNVRILGLTTDAEQGNPTGYVSILLKEMFGDKLQLMPEVENAHRIGPMTKSGQRAMIVRMQRLVMREEILRVARKEKVFEARGMKLRFFPDLTANTAKARASYREVRNKLWNAGIKHGIIHPATLVLTFRGETRRFTDNVAAETYVKTVIEPAMENKE
uniref:L1 transposable element RRM domain-containing protein n=1 Tax=Sphaeramia orbicularis TaxID=375764 RepID=A0A673B6A9_9TELE